MTNIRLAFDYAVARLRRTGSVQLTTALAEFDRIGQRVEQAAVKLRTEADKRTAALEEKRAEVIKLAKEVTAANIQAASQIEQAHRVRERIAAFTK